MREGLGAEGLEEIESQNDVDWRDKVITCWWWVS